MVILIPIIIVVAVAGYWTYHNYAPQMIQNEASKVINNTGSTIQQISSQSQQSFSNLQNSATLTTNGDNRVPIAVYDNCNSLVRADNMRDIGTDCGGKSFRFNMPDILQQSLQGQELVGVKTKVYQYGTNDFKIGLYDQLGEKNYTVTLWQLP